jgi:hypothetical protein
VYCKTPGTAVLKMIILKRTSFTFDTEVRYAIDDGSSSLLNFDKPTYLPDYTKLYLRFHKLITDTQITLSVVIATTLRS